MGRVARYKKVKSIDPFAKKPTWNSELGDASTIRRVKRRSKTAIKFKEQKASKFQRRGKLLGSNAEKKKTGGSNGFGDEDGYDLPPDGEDEFDIKDLMGSVKKQTFKASAILETKEKIPTLSSATTNQGDEKLTRKVESVDLRGVSVKGNNSNGTNDASKSSKNAQKSNANNKKNAPKQKSDPNKLVITSKTPTSEIIAAYSNPKGKKSNNQSNAPSSSSMSKQERRKAFLEQKKSKKRNRGSAFDDEDDDNEGIDGSRSKGGNSTSAAKSAPVYARSAIGDQVERPPTFTSLPRGASKIKKSKTPKHSLQELLEDEGHDEKTRRIRKEQMTMDALRENVMKQYAILRESRKGGGSR